jgi:FkbM family methyltransferase
MSAGKLYARYREVWGRRHRKRPGKLDFLKQFRIHTVLDIGANVGQFSKEVRAILPTAQIYAFEPLAGCFQDLTRALKGDRYFKAFPYALGATAGKTSMHKNTYSPSSSLMEMGDAHKEAFPHAVGIESKEPVDVRRLDDIAPELVLKDDVFIKMDVQGFENRVIDGGERALSTAKVVILENSFYELYVGQVLFDGIYERMKKMGFSYRGSIGQKHHPVTGDILFEDSIFIRA